MKRKKKYIQAGLEQLAEKQIEEVDRKLAKQYGLPLETHTEPHVQAGIMSDLWSGIPIARDEE